MLALLGVSLTLLTDSGYWDVAGTAGIGLLLVAVAVVLGIETKSLLLGESAALEDQRDIEVSLEKESLLIRGRRLSPMPPDGSPAVAPVEPGGARGLPARSL